MFGTKTIFYEKAVWCAAIFYTNPSGLTPNPLDVSWECEALFLFRIYTWFFFFFFYRICINGCSCAVKAFKMPCRNHSPGNLGVSWHTPRMAKTSSYWLPRRMLLASREALHPGMRGRSCTAGSKQSQNGCSHNKLGNNWTATRITHQRLQWKDETLKKTGATHTLRS